MTQQLSQGEIGGRVTTLQARLACAQAAGRTNGTTLLTTHGLVRGSHNQRTTNTTIAPLLPTGESEVVGGLPCLRAMSSLSMKAAQQSALDSHKVSGIRAGRFDDAVSSLLQACTTVPAL